MFARPIRVPPPGWLASRLLVAACIILFVVGCGWSHKDAAVLDDGLEGQVVFATTHCEVANADGKRCDKKTCKTDAESNCEYFASRCLATGHNYSGGKDAGTCTRVLDN